MQTKIKLSFEKYMKLTDEETHFLNQKLTVKTLKKRSFAYEAGQVCQAVLFIEKGCMRYFYLNEGVEQTGQFFFEGSWYTDYESFLRNKPTEQFIQAIETTTIWYLPKKALEEMYEKYPKFERFGRIMAENAYIGSRKSKELLQNLTPEERYLRLIEERPKVIERIPLKYIASYLGIQPESLSRIRKRLFDAR